MIFNSLVSMGIDGDLAIDIGTVLFNQRPIGLLHVNTDRIMDLQNYLFSQGLNYRVSRELKMIHDPHSGQYILKDNNLVSTKTSSIHEIWISSQKISEIDIENFIKNPGFFLRYPDCCIASYQQNKEYFNIYDNYINYDKSRSWMLNRFSMLFSKSRIMLDYLPCSLGCHKSIQLITNLLPSVERSLGKIEFKSRIAENQKYYGIMNGFLVKFDQLNIENNKASVSVSSITKRSDITCGLNYNKDKIGLLLFDHNRFYIHNLKKIEFLQNDRATVLNVNLL